MQRDRERGAEFYERQDRGQAGVADDIGIVYSSSAYVYFYYERSHIREVLEKMQHHMFISSKVYPSCRKLIGIC